MASQLFRSKKNSVLPGFRLTLGFTLFYLGLIVLIPLAAVFWKTSTLTWAQFWQTVTMPTAVASYRLTFGASFLAALVNAVFGLVVAWVLVRYEFFGKKIVDSLVDLPFALPTAVAGITLASLYGQNGWIGQLLTPLGIKIANTQIGIFIAGNIPMKTQITPVVIMQELDMFDYAKATAIAVVMLVISFVLLLAINVLQWWANRHNTTSLA